VRQEFFRPFLVLLLLVGLPSLLRGQQGTTVDFDKLIEKADALLEDAKKAYEEAREKSSAPLFVDAGFKLEECRIKFMAIQEIGPPEKQKVAGDRLRAVNQLSKLIHDGKVAVAGPPADPAAGPGTSALPEKTLPDPSVAPALSLAPVDVSKRLPVPDAARLKESERLIRDLYKDGYAKKAAADRKALCRQLLSQAGKSQDDPPGLWVLCREAQDIAIQLCDLGLLLAAIDAAATRFDVDAMVLKTSALTSAGKAAKGPEDFAALAEAYSVLIEDLVNADQYDPAEKAAEAALQHARKSANPAIVARMTIVSKEVSESKALYKAFKNVLEVLAKSPEDPGANLEMGKFLCFVKNNWEFGLRFIVKGSDAALKALAEKEQQPDLQSSDLVALGDSWFGLADKEKSTLRKSRMNSHGTALYTAALPGASGLVKARIEKRLDQLREASSAASGPSPNAKVVISSAKIAYGGKTADVTKILQDALQATPHMPIKIDDNWVDGTGGNVKVLTIEAQIDGKQVKETVKEGDVILLPKIPADGLPMPRASQKFLLIEAYCGAGLRWVNVTEKLKGKLADTSDTISTTLVGFDPLPGKLKTLTVVFEARGRRYLRHVVEGFSAPMLQ
jgi:hypothetical protein